MANTARLIILGAVIAVFALALGNPTVPPFEPNEEFWECRNKSLTQRGKFDDCLSEDFSDEEINATLTMYNDTNCLICKHLCRKLDAVNPCIAESSAILSTLSNKSQKMVPFVKTLVEESLQALCDDDGMLINAFLNDDNGDCLTASWRACGSKLERADDFHRIAFCDFTEPENDPYSKEFICQKYLDFFECGEVELGKCSEEMKNAASNVISKWRDDAFCGKYLNVIKH